MTYKKIFLYIIIGCIILSAGLLIKKYYEPMPSITIGIVHSPPGPWSFHEKNTIDAALFALKEINSQGGILKNNIKPIILEAEAHDPASVDLIEKFITQNNVNVIFSCWKPTIHPDIITMIDQHDVLLFHPGLYTGFEQSSHVIYNGSTANQQVMPSIIWCLNNVGTKFFLIGSDDAFSRLINKFITQLVTLNGGTIVGEEYIPLESNTVRPAIEKIINAKADLVANTLIGTSNITFFKEIKQRKIMHEQLPIVSFFITESEITSIGIENIAGHYVANSYFENVSWASWEVNKKFVAAFKKEYDTIQFISDLMQVVYFSIHLWKNSVIQAGTFDTKKVYPYLFSQSFFAPEGMLYINFNNLTTWRFPRVGKVQKDGQCFLVWESGKSAPPQPYSLYIKKQEWEHIQSKFHEIEEV